MCKEKKKRTNVGKKRDREDVQTMIIHFISFIVISLSLFPFFYPFLFFLSVRESLHLVFGSSFSVAIVIKMQRVEYN
jgi:hypothetical protein